MPLSPPVFLFVEQEFTITWGVFYCHSTAKFWGLRGGLICAV